MCHDENEQNIDAYQQHGNTMTKVNKEIQKIQKLRAQKLRAQNPQ